MKNKLIGLLAVASSPNGFPALLGWIVRNGQNIYWLDPTQPISVVDGDLVFIQYPTYAAGVELPWRCLYGAAFDFSNNSAFFFNGLAPAGHWQGTFRVHADCSTDTFSLEWVTPYLEAPEALPLSCGPRFALHPRAGGSLSKKSNANRPTD